MSTDNEYHVTESSGSDQLGSVVTRGFAIRNRETIFLPAEEFRGYEEAVPGSGEKILQLLIQQAEHRMEIEKSEMEIERNEQVHRHLIREKQVKEASENRSSLLGFGGIALIGVFLLAVFFALMGMEAAAIAAIALPTLQGIAQLISSMRNPKEK